MGRYNFQAPGAEAYNAIEKLLMQRAMDERQQMQDQIKRENDEAQAKRQSEELALRQQQESRVAEAQAQSQQGLESEREFRRASTLVDNSMPNDQVDTATADMLTRQGYGGAMQRTQPTQGQHLGVDENSVDQYAVAPGIIQMRGGSRYLNAQAQRDATSANAEANRQAAADRAAESDRTRKEIAGMAAMGAAETRALRNQFTQTQIDAVTERTQREREKADAATAERAKTETASRQASQNAYDLIGRLETHGGVSRITGAYEMRGWTQPAIDAAAIRDQVVAALTVPNLGTLKGPMSDKDIIFVKELATRLQKPGLSEQEFRLALSEAKRVLEGKGAAPEAATGGRPSASDLIRKYGGG